jgi:hypothetical protein
MLRIGIDLQPDQESPVVRMPVRVADQRVKCQDAAPPDFWGR